MATTPQDLAAAYRGTRERIGDLCADVPDDVLESTVPACPDWTIRELLAHLTVIAAEPVAGNVPGDDVQAWMAEGMEKRADASAAELIAEWDEAGPAMEGVIEAMGDALRNVVYDAAVHEHDLRQALGRPGERGSQAVQIGLDALLDQLAERVSEHGLPPVRVRIVDDDRQVVCGEGDPEVTLVGERFELFRLLGNRRSRNQVLSAEWTGDPEPYLGALEAMPFPSDDVDE